MAVTIPGAPKRSILMTRKNHRMVPHSESDPFGERTRLHRKSFQLLGARIHFDSNSQELLRIVDLAYAGLPPHRFPRSPDLHVRLLLTSPGRATGLRGAAPITMFHGAGLLGGSTNSSNFVVLSPRERAALVVVPANMLRFPYHTRYELIEFAVYTLAARAQRLVSLHAGCVGVDGRGILLMGPSGAGKSTLALHGLLGGLEFLTEDSTFVVPETMYATGIANFLHVRAESLHWLGRSDEAAAIRRSPVIKRRSGVKKFELDLRVHKFRLAKSPLKIVGVVFLSSRRAAGNRLLKPLSKSDLRSRLATTQAYAASQPQWPIFSKRLSALDAFELHRGRHPVEAVESLRSLLTSL